MQDEPKSPRAREVERLNKEARELRAVLAEYLGPLPTSTDHAHLLAKVRSCLEDVGRRLDALQAAAREEPVEWSREWPTDPGHYWTFRRGVKRPGTILRNGGTLALIGTNTVYRSQFDTLWGPRIVEPSGPDESDL